MRHADPTVNIFIMRFMRTFKPFGRISICARSRLSRRVLEKIYDAGGGCF